MTLLTKGKLSMQRENESLHEQVQDLEKMVAKYGVEKVKF